MGYNKAREERKWRLWKQTEEKKMREAGVDEGTIQQLREQDWAVFNSERRFYEKWQAVGTYLESVAEGEPDLDIHSVDNLLDSIETKGLHQMLLAVDKLTLQIVLMKMQGYSTHEIATSLGVTEKSVYRRMDRLKEKIKKVFE
jgi:RNA polymerase sigma-70 factor (ECF subfamily)